MPKLQNGVVVVNNRQLGDYGSYEEMLTWVLDVNRDGQEREFLEAWRSGDLTEWPEYISWLEERSLNHG